MRTVGTIREIWRYPVKAMAGEAVRSCMLGPRGLAGDRHWALRDEVRAEIQSCKTRPQLLHCQVRCRGDAGPDGIAPVSITFPDGIVLDSDDPAMNAKLSALTGRASTLHALRPASQSDFYRRYNPHDGSWLVDLKATFDRAPGEPYPDFSQLPQLLVDHVTVPGTFFLVAPLHVVTTATLDHLRGLNPAADWDVRRFRPNIVVEVDPSYSGLVEETWAGRRLRIGDADILCAGPTPRCGAITRAQGPLRFDASMLRTVVNRAGQNVGAYGVVEREGPVRVGDPVCLVDD